MTQSVTFREAAAGDLPTIVDLLADDPFGATRNPVFASHSTAYRIAFDEMSRDPNNRCIVTETSGRIVGCYQLTFIRGLSHTGGLRAQIESVRVAESHRGSGLGTEMMQDAIMRARLRGAVLVQLTTDARREATRRFYERLGFTASHHGMKLVL